MFSLSLDSCDVKENAEDVKTLVEEMNDSVEGLTLDSCDLLV